MRFKQRYLLCEIVFEDGASDQSINSSLIFVHIRRTIENLFGDYGAGCLQQSLNVKYYNPNTGLVMIRCSRAHLRLVWNAVMSLTLIKNRACRFTCLHIGGTIRSCQKKALEHSRAILLELDQSQLNSNTKSKNVTTVPQSALRTELEKIITQNNQKTSPGKSEEKDKQVLARVVQIVPSSTGEMTEISNPTISSQFIQAEKDLTSLLYDGL